MADNTYLNLAGQHVILDREQAFLLYTAFCGDVVRTAQALGISPTVICRIVDEDDWVAKLEPIIRLRKSNDPLDFERGLNRAINFVQAHRLRLFLERALKVFMNWSDEDLKEQMQPESFARFRKGQAVSDPPPVERKLTARAFTDFAAALEKAHAMTYMALADTASDRAKRKEEHKGATAADMHVKLAEAMASVGAMQTPRATLLDAQLAEADAIAPAATIPVDVRPHPLDRDDPEL